MLSGAAAIWHAGVEQSPLLLWEQAVKALLGHDEWLAGCEWGQLGSQATEGMWRWAAGEK